jgi:hypothetical protein
MTFSTGFLSGCNENILKKNVYEIGESLIFENVKYTFLSAGWDDGNYVLKIKGENTGDKEESSNAIITQYEMQDGYTYKPLKIYNFTAVTFKLKPGGEDTRTLIDFSSIDKDYSPVAKIHLGIFSPGGNVTIAENARAIEISVA